MNIAGTVATTVLIITALTVVGGLLSYAIFKARERSRSRLARARASSAVSSLEFFVEYRLPTAQTYVEGQSTLLVSGPEVGRSPWPLVIGLIASLLIAGGGVATYLYVDWSWLSGPGPSVRHHDLGLRAVERGTMPDLSRLVSRAPSYFVSPKFDLNRDGKIQVAERRAIHERVPQFVLIGADDNGSHEGLTWMMGLFKRYHAWGSVSYFMTANYLEGRKNYLGGPITAEWQKSSDGNFVGIHGTTHAPGAETWDTGRWAEEHTVPQAEIVKRLRLPAGWAWAGYPWGTRAPFLMLTDPYFQALKQLKHKVLYDSSLVVRPHGSNDYVPPENEVRDLSWPFTLDSELPRDLDPPYLPSSGARARFGRHEIWEIPVYAWFLRPPGKKPLWQPSLDYNLWEHYSCNGSKANEDIVRDVLSNLDAHYRGNRAPFIIGFHARGYVKEEPCHRATLEQIFTGIGRRMDEGKNIRFSSMPDLLLWIGRMAAN
jgi:hypothetical protein